MHVDRERAEEFECRWMHVDRERAGEFECRWMHVDRERAGELNVAGCIGIERGLGS